MISVFLYQILGKLGEGGLGGVLNADDAKLPQTISLNFGVHDHG
jgi:hypothetical protein